MIKFPSIEQFRNVIRHVKSTAQYVGKDSDGTAIYDHSIPLPTLKFRGTVKLHGTNAGIVYDIDTREITYQSRERELSLTSDNAGFMLWAKSHEDVWHYIFENIWVPTGTKNIAIFGEWCGQGIQKGVAINEVHKMFVVFAVKTVGAGDKSTWLDISDENYLFSGERIFSIFSFPTYEIDIDFNYPELAQNKLIALTEEVEAECPVGKAFGVSGIGEGICWYPVDNSWNTSAAWFKTKGEKHSATKVKKLVEIDVQAVENMREFVEAVVTETRLEQGLDVIVRERMLPFEMTSMGEFIRWVYNDVLKEETDTIISNQIDSKKLGSAIANVARPWFVKKINEGIGL